MSTTHQAGPLQRKSDLGYNYAPGVTGSDDPTKRNIPDSRLLNRSEWYEILYFVNKFANDFGNASRAVALKAENLIHTVVPKNLHSHDHIVDWLRRNWKLYA